MSVDLGVREGMAPGVRIDSVELRTSRVSEAV